MKRMPSTLISFLAANPNCTKADCFVITLPTGQTITATEGQWEITFLTSTPGWTGAQTTFKSMKYGVWSRGSITSEAGNCNAGTMDLTCIVAPEVLFPGTTIGLLNGALNHLFDGATVWVYTAYMAVDKYGDVSVGVETKFQGTVTKCPGIARNVVKFEVADPLYLLNLKVPSRVLQANCGWSFADSNCTLDPANYTVNFTAAGGSTVNALTPVSAFSQAAGYFTQGVVKCLTGNNAGLSQTVKVHAGGTLAVVLPWLLPVAPGDTFAVIKGCDKTEATCAATLKANGVAEPKDFKVRFGGTPFVPAPSSSI